MSRTVLLIMSLLLLVPLWPGTSSAGQVYVAVAANFTAPMKEISQRFTAETGHRAIVSYGSTGKLYAQIHNGAPYEVFLAADQARPRLLYEDGLGGAPFTYAIGRLALWSPDPDLIDDAGAVLGQPRFARLAVANPKTAPYGAAALQVIEATGAAAHAVPRLVRGDNIAQTYQFVMTGNAQLGFVALSQVISDPAGSRWLPPQDLYDPIRQDVILLHRGRDNAAAQDFAAFLQGDSVLEITRRYGYATE